MAIITPAKEIHSLANHLAQHLSAILEHMAAKPEWIDAEIREMSKVRYTTTRSRSVLGTMNDYKLQIEAMLYEAEDFSPLEMAIYLSSVIVGPLNFLKAERSSAGFAEKKLRSGLIPILFIAPELKATGVFAIKYVCYCKPPLPKLVGSSSIYDYKFRPAVLR